MKSVTSPLRHASASWPTVHHALRVRDDPVTREEREERRPRADEDNYGKRLQPGYNLGEWWTAEVLALLGTSLAVEVAKRIGKSRDAVRAQRVRRNIKALVLGE
jgi:hypothetical protein